ncbi:hypothetical protein PI124_g21546 [Phytophthora idaei]|nr:hypothetical protein PI124_g21546 [Phytophthora idaei]
MVEISLECAIVGQAGTFDVTIDDGKKVSVLKNAILKKNRRTIACDDKDLQLFLAKKGDAWLDWAGVAAVTLDGDGHPQGFEQMDPTLWINNDKHFGKNFGPAEGEVHVLVVVPEGAIGSALSQPANSAALQNIAWYGTRGSIVSGEGIDLDDPRTLSRATLTADIIRRLEETHRRL